MGSNPYIRKSERLDDDDDFEACCAGCAMERHNHTEPEEVGFPVCFFHYHEKGERCCSRPNSERDDEEENLW